MELPKAYNFQEAEDKIYALWEKSGFFQPKADHPNGDNPDTFSIAMPPPNATGELHIGHAMFLTLQDILTRYHRMKGDITLWLPGTDHASIATQNKVEKILMEKEGKTRQDLGRAVFLRRVNQYVKESQQIIRKQIRKIGSSCDWSRERYTLDAGLTMAVQEVFVRMYNDGLIYRGDRIVNWCPRCESTLADDEVEYKNTKGNFYYLKYGPVIIGTARPETKFLDKTIIVHPQDKRYRHLVGKKLIVPWINGEVEAQVIADKSADMSMGTGAMTLTPAHSFIDFELAQKYGLPIVQIIDQKGNLTKRAGEFAGINANKARQIIVKKMQEKGLIERIDENYEHNLSVCYRCNTPVEPLVSKQWFIDVNKKLRIMNYELRRVVGKDRASLKEIALSVVKGGEIDIIPKKFEKIYYHWMNNLRDWCISRQIWFGHRIPVWYCDNKVKSQKSKVKTTAKNSKLTNCQEIIAAREKPKECPKCGSTKLKQDPDTLDTWFSSGLWTFSTLGWPEETSDLKRFHPTSVMETGYDILFFWVARMILMTTYILGKVPFKTVYLHGLVRDKLGRKMSKSLGNGIDPLDMIKKYGADAVRLSLIIGTTPGNDIRLYEEKIAGYRNFVTKVWNIGRYIMSNNKCQKPNQIQMSNAKFTLADKWVLFELGELIKRVNKNLKKYQFSRAGEDIYDFMWHKLADWYIEAVKIENQPHQPAILTYVLEKCLILLHPFVPFVTEEIWGKLKTTRLIVEPWVDKIDFKISKTEAEKFKKNQKEISKKRNASAIKKSTSKKETAQLKRYVQSLEARLEDEAFLTKAPAEVIQKEKTRLRETLAKLA
ncbi:MAG: valine--tRNA ligase [Patescibacteria group bacterium]